MSLTVSDLLNTFSPNMSLIAGQGGLSRKIASCGILDYELVPELKDRYYHTNFQEGQFILSSLLYAKDNPFILTDAVKHLIAKGASALAIRNVFKIKIPENVIRLANAQNFPIIMLLSMELPFEKIIYTTEKHFEIEKEGQHKIEVLNNIYFQDLSKEDVEKAALKLNASFNEQFFAIYCKTDGFTPSAQKRKIADNFEKSKLITYEDFISEFNKGYLIIKSNEDLQMFYNDNYIRECLKEIFEDEPISKIGISNRHGTLTQFKKALNEAFFSSIYNEESGNNLSYYKDLGDYRVIFPFSTKEPFLDFSNEIMEVLEDYDSENNSNLVETLITYIKCDSRIDATAKKLGQHEQTIRYRLKNIYNLTTTNMKSQGQKEQLSLACKIYIANQLLNE